MYRNGYFAYLLSIIIFLLLQSVCSKPIKNDEPTEIPLRKLTVQEEKLNQIDNSFGLKIFREIHQQDQTATIFISPLSISLALSMAINGADGTTRDQMIHTLEMQELSLDQINQANQSLTEYLVGMDHDVTLQIANSIWYQDNFSVKTDFLNVNRTYYQAEIEKMDFSASSAIDRINHWVSDKTQAKITKILNQIDPLSVMFIINAIYFKGTWTHQFDPQKTHAGVFYQETSSSLTCDMMHQEKRMAYLETEILQAVSLPYGDSLFYMTIFLPKEGYTVNSIMSQLTQSQWNQWLSQFNSDSVNLTMPKFKMEYEIKLNDVLQSMGMIAAFNPDQANFSGISDQDIYISEVRHKSMVDVNEEGTVAAAVTIIDFRLTSVGTVKYMTINRPFVFMIHNKQTGTILFMGKISKPEYQ